MCNFFNFLIFFAKKSGEMNDDNDDFRPVLGFHTTFKALKADAVHEARCAVTAMDFGC